MNFSSVADFIAAIDKAPLLSKCGGPYPLDSPVSPATSLSEALDRLSGSILDAVPRSSWDKVLSRAYRESCKAARKQSSLFRMLTLGSKRRVRAPQIAKLVDQRVANSVLNTELATTDRIFLIEHLTILFEKTSLVLEANNAEECLLVMKAANYALEGYLPFDFAGESVVLW